jgi:hypothetical protein
MAVNMTLWRYEIRRAGLAALIAPPAALLLAVAAATLARTTGGNRDQVAQLVLVGLEAILPLAMAMVALSIVARDGCRELQLSFPVPHLVTIGRRLGVLAAIAALLCLAYSAGAALTGWWSGPGFVGSVLVWLAPAVWLTGLAVLGAAVTRSIVVASSAVAVVWLGEQIAAQAFAGHAVLRHLFLFFTSRIGDGSGWFANRLTLVAVGLLFVLAAVAWLAQPERMLTEEEA